MMQSYTEPTVLTKGDSASWIKTLSAYPAGDGWALNYYIRGAVALDVSTIASGSNFLAELLPSETDTLAAGDYIWSSKVTKGSERITIATGNLTILPDISDESAGYESRPHSKIMLDAIESVLQGKANQDVSSYSIQGRSLTRMSAEELEQWRDKYRKEWRTFQRRDARRKGKITNRKIQVRFTR